MSSVFRVSTEIRFAPCTEANGSRKCFGVTSCAMTVGQGQDRCHNDIRSGSRPGASVKASARVRAGALNLSGGSSIEPVPNLNLY